MKRMIYGVLCLLALHGISGSRAAQAAPPVAPGYIAVTSATASTSYQTRTGWMTANGNGITEPLTGLKCATHGNTDVTMWLNNNTAPNTDWIQYDLGSAHNLTEMWIWNTNQAGYIARGLKDVYIEYKVNATDDWSTLTQAGNKTFTLAQASGASAIAATNLVGGQPVNFGGTSARFVRIRPAGAKGVGTYNTTDNYAGLGEVRFYEGSATQPFISSSAVAFPGTPLNSEKTLPLTVGALGGSGSLTLNSVSFQAGRGPAAFSFVTTPTLNKAFNAGEVTTYTLAFRPRVYAGSYATTLTLNMTVGSAALALQIPLTGTGVYCAPGYIGGVTATASTVAGGRAAQAAVDGTGIAEFPMGLKTSLHALNPNSVTATNPANTWLSVGGATNPIANQWMEYDLGRTVALGEMWVWNYNEFYTNGNWYNFRGVKDCKLYYKVNLTDSWTQLGSSVVTLAQAPNSALFAATNQVGGAPINFGGVQARYVRLEVVNNYRSATSTDEMVGLAEVRFYDTSAPSTACLPVVQVPDNDLGTIPVNETASVKVAIGASAGTGNIQITNVTMPSGAPLTVAPALTPTTFAAGTVTTYTLTVQPTAVGSFSYPITLDMTTPSGPVTLQVTARGTAVKMEPGFITGVTATANQADKGPATCVNGAGMTEANGVMGSKGATAGNSVSNLWRNNGNQAVDNGTVWIQFDLGKIYNLSEMWVWNYNEISGSNYYTQRGIKNCTITYSTDGTNWTTLGGTGNTFTLGRCANSTAAPASNQDITGLPVDFSGTAVRYVKIACNSTWEKTTGNGFIGLSEVRFYQFVPPPNKVRNWSMFE